MPAYNKPGVYVQENLTPNIPVYTDSAVGVAVFIGLADRGPTTSVSGTLVGVPTLVTSWADFCTKFNFGSTDTVFSDTYSSSDSRNLSYAMYSFFNNNGNQAYVLRTPKVDSVKASSVFYVQSAIGTSTSSIATATVSGSSVTFTLATGLPNITTTTNGVVTFSGFGDTKLNKSWPIFSVASSSSITVTGVSGLTTATSANVVATAVALSSTPTMTLSSKNPGGWGNKVWVKTSAGSNGAGYFDLAVYYNAVGATGDALNSANDYRVDYWPNVSLNPSDRNYAPTYVLSDWVDISTTATTAKDPFYTYFKNTDGSVTAGPVGLGTVTNTINSNWGAGTNGTDSGNVAAIATTVAQLDGLPGPLTINYAGSTDTTNIQGLLTYSGTRGDSFTVVDCDATTVSATITTANSISTDLYGSYGALYYPQLIIPDPATKGTSNKTIAPGGAVVAAYMTTDTSRGVFKAPAGTGTSLKSNLVVNVASVLTNAEFDAVSTANPTINIIRLIPGSNYCIMGARTLKKGTTDDRFIPVRRTLNYLRRSITNATSFAVFEPNGPLLWSQVTSVLENLLYNFWKQGGLQGNTASQAYYVKCDATTNTPSAQSSGELRIEVGVALQKPAEFVVIKLSQIQGSTTVTTSV